MIEDKAKITARNKFTLYLQSKHLRKTPERFAILNKIFYTNALKCFDKTKPLI